MMKARGCLTEEKAWKLFTEKAGDNVNNVEIQPLAKDVCGECGGLPLAIIAVGSAMRGKTDTRLWQSALEDLRSSIFPDGIESQVYKALKLSYDSLPSDSLKLCFLYCSLYPQSYGIKISELVQCWLAENIIDEQLKYQSAYCKGLELVETLKSRCLLEDSVSGISVKMNDVVRDVAIQIGKSNGTLIVFSGHGFSKSRIIELSKEVERFKWISFVDNKDIKLLGYEKEFPNVTTILSRNTEGLLRVSGGFLRGFPAVRVLNMRKLLSFPRSVLHLTELRALLLHWYESEGIIIEELPRGAKLIVLKLDGYTFRKVPKGVEEQTDLKLLHLGRGLKTVERDVMLNLSALEILHMENSGYRWPTKRKSMSNGVTLQDLSGLESLKEVYLDLADVEATYAECGWMERLEKFCFRYVLHDKVKTDKDIHISLDEESEVGSFILHANCVAIMGTKGEEIFANFNSADMSNSKIKSLALVCCVFSVELSRPVPTYSSFSNLESLSLADGWRIRSFSAYTVGIIFPQLRSLKIGSYFDLTEVFHGDPAETQAVVPKLKRLVLNYLKSLQGLSNFHSSELWQSLEVLKVSECPNLKKLPHMSSIREIKGEEEWWNNLEWDSPQIKSDMSQFFKPRRQ